MPAPLEPFYTLLARRIRDLRISRGITQEDLGSRLTPPLTRISVINIESARQRIYAHTLVEIANILDISLADLLTDPNAPPKPAPAPTLEKFASELAKKLPLKLEEVRELTSRIGYAQTEADANVAPREVAPRKDEKEEPR